MWVIFFKKINRESFKATPIYLINRETILKYFKFVQTKIDFVAFVFLIFFENS